MDLVDTIVAVASAPGGAVRGVVRLSGQQAIAITEQIASLRSGAPLDLAHLRQPAAVEVQLSLATADEADPNNRPKLPATLFVWLGRRSYTREPIVELHTVGAPPLLDLLVRTTCQQGARLAEPGEFTLRAFLAGRIDLTQAEAVLGVIDAEGPDALETALGQLAGGMAKPLGELREEMLLLLADLEAGLDFADEEIEFIAPQVLAERLASAQAHVEALVAQLDSRTVAKVVPQVVLVGPTNAGKSSLFNALVDRWGDATRSAGPAIVSPQPGATRDYLSARLSHQGVVWELIDTAGAEPLLEKTSPSVAQAAQQMTDFARTQATLVLECSELGFAPRHSELPPNTLRVLTKQDVGRHKSAPPEESLYSTSALYSTSTKTGAGLDVLGAAIRGFLTETTLAGDATAMVPSTALRSETSLRSALESLQHAAEIAARHESEELVAGELRLALNHLGQVAGAIYTDDVLDRVFSRFCIGK